MSPYHMILLLLLAGTVVEHIQKRTSKVYFAVSFLVLSGFLCFRFGQGTDYFGYAYIYHSLPANPLQAVHTDWIHSEIGWKILCACFRALGVSFPVFVMILSVCMLILFFRFLQKFGGNRKMFALLICYHTLYLTYFFSVLRQGIVAAVFLGVLLPWLLRRDYVKYYIISAVLISIHSVSAVLLILPLLQGVQLKYKQLIGLVVLGFLLGVACYAVDVGVLLAKVLPIVYLGESDLSVVALLERIGTFLVVAFCYYVYLEGQEPDQADGFCKLFKIYALGMFLYNLLMWSPLISSRLCYLFKLVEIILICGCIVRCKKSQTIVLVYCVALCSVVYLKNINSYIQQANYQNASVVNYPYVSVFNWTDILNYRTDTIDYPFP